MSKYLLIWMAGVVLFAASAPAAMISAVHDDDTGYVDTAGGVATAFPYAGSTSLDAVRSAIFIFELPMLPTGETIVSANFSAWLEANAVNDPPSGAGENGDLYALRVSDDKSKLVTDSFVGADDAGNTKITDNLVVPSSATNAWYSTGDSATLGAWLAAEYSGDTPNGQYVLLRVNVDATPVGTFDLYRFSENGDDNPPTLVITTIPEPASFGMLVLGGLMLARRR